MRAHKPAFRPQCEQLEAREVPAFGVGGFATTDLAHTSGEAASDIAIQADGKIVAAGHVGLARYNPDGSLDMTFNAGGAQPGVVPITTGLSDVLIQPDGKILVAGYTFSGNKQLALLMRFNPDGTPDATFGTNGKFTTGFKKTSESDNLRGIALQSDGKIVAVARIDGNTWGVARFKANGGLDTSFDKDGWLTTDFGTGSPPSAQAIAIQSDGRIVVGGDVFVNSAQRRDAAMVRYLPGGAIDTSFGNAGKVLVDFVASNYLYDLGLQPDGRIVFVGYSDAPANPIRGFLGRLNSNGSLDSSFDGDGRVYISAPAYDHPTYGTIHPNIRFQSLAIQADGKIVAYSPGFAMHDVPLAVARVNADGSLDTSFSDDGVVMYAWPSGGGFGMGGEVFIQPDGKIVLSNTAVGDHFALARLNTDGTLDG